MRLWGLLLVLGAIPVMAQSTRIVEEIVVKVNGEIITRGDIEHNRNVLRAELEQRGLKGPQLEEAFKEREKDLLRDEIDQRLLVQRAKDLNINVDSEVSKQLAAMQLENKISDPEEFQKWIRAQSGMTYEDFRDQMKNSMLTRRVIGQEVSSKINIPRAQVQKYYEEHKEEFIREERIFLSEIFVSTEGKTGAELEAAEKKAKSLHQRAKAGEKFGELARDNSESATARNYGQLPGYKRDELRKDISDIVFNEERGFITDLIKLDNGYLILRVEEKYKAGLASIEEVQNEIMERLYMPQFQPAVREYLTRLRYDAFLEMKEGYVDSGAAPGKLTAWTDPAELKPETVTKEEVASKTRRKRLFWAVPVPGTQISTKSSS